MAKLREGIKAPAFEAPDQDGRTVTLDEFKGRPLVLYFYPKDATPGCTVEAKAFRDGMAKFRRLGAAVLGVSPDSPECHRKFRHKEKLTFRLLSDEDKKVARAYGTWVKKKLYGREYMGNARSTFVIGPDGKIRRIFEKVKPDGHAEEVIAALKELKS